LRDNGAHGHAVFADRFDGAMDFFRDFFVDFFGIRLFKRVSRGNAGKFAGGEMQFCRIAPIRG
jgi:hypothetical protein